jgi:aminopeptidase S
VETRPFALSAQPGQRLDFRWTFAHYASSTSADFFRVAVVPASGVPVVVHDVRGAAVDRDATWTRTSIALDTWAGQTVRLRFSAADASPEGLVEAAFDDVRVTRPN